MISRQEPQYTWRGARGPSLVALVGDAPVRLDPEGVRAAFGEIDATDATCIEGARIVSPALAARAEVRPLRALLEGACARLPAGRVALALSGGVDSAVLAALLAERAVLYTLAPRFPDYGEETEASAMARRLGAELRRVPVDEADFVDALPAVIRACERPLYNLHPVSRHLLANAARADGFAVLVTGDGADEVFRGTSGADYLPVVGALTRAAGLVPSAPFLDPEVAPFVAPDPDKRALRALAEELGVPPAIAQRPKRARFAPPMDLTLYLSPMLDTTRWPPLADARGAECRVDARGAECRVDAPETIALGHHLGRVPSAATDRERVGWATLGLFARLFPGLAL
jgi:hypothetical protein